MKLAVASFLAAASAFASFADAKKDSCEPIRVLASEGSCDAFLKADPIALISSPHADNATIVVKQMYSKDRFDYIGIETHEVGNPQVACVEHYGKIPFQETLVEETVVCDPATKASVVEIFLVDSSIEMPSSAVSTEGETINMKSCDVGEEYHELLRSAQSCSIMYEIPCGCKDAPVVVEEEEDASEDAAADEVALDVEEQRRLDAVKGEKPSEEPTWLPTPYPSRRPTNAPTTLSPTVTQMPTYPEGPGCSEVVQIDESWTGPKPFCYDSPGGGGRGGRRRMPIVTCSTINESENCGEIDFVITGKLEADNLRCGDVWYWFDTCVSYFGCRKLNTGAKFKFGKPSRKLTFREYAFPKPEYEFYMNGNGVDGKFRWICDDRDSAWGMKYFADAVYSNSIVGQETLFQTANATCDSEAPSLSMVPTSSPAPTMLESIDCATEMNRPFQYRRPPAPGERHMVTYFSNSAFEVKYGCIYHHRGMGVPSADYTEPLPWVIGIANMFRGTLLDTGFEANHYAPLDIFMISNYDQDGKFYTKIAEHAAVLNAPMIFEFPTNYYRNTFGEGLKKNIFKNRGYLWQTVDDVNRCGSSPLCFSDKPYSTCYMDLNSENCGDFDYAIIDRPNGEIFRTGDPYEFWNKCIETIPFCQGTAKNEDELIGYTKLYLKSSKNEANEMYETTMYRWGQEQKKTWRCEGDYDYGKAVYDFTKLMMDTGLMTKEAARCTATPTESPTACREGFLTQFPLNLAITIDISFSTYDTKFNGTTVGDRNDDGKSDTILDAEIAAVIRLLKAIEGSDELDNTNVNIGFIVFESSATYGGTYMPAGQYKPLNADGTINTAILDDLKLIRTEEFSFYLHENNVGFTNFDDALDKTVDYFEHRQSQLGASFADWTNLLVFLSDGKPTVRGDGDNEGACFEQQDCLDGGLPANKPDSDDTPIWESGELSFCFSGDKSCDAHAYKHCVIGQPCTNAPETMDFTSELARLDELNVQRLSIGVGLESEVSKGSALYQIDSNPYKDELDLLPKQVVTTDDLADALRNLCHESTPNPTELPSVSPTSAPTDGPTPGPTSGPTTSPTSGPTTGPTSAPTGTPTQDICEYHIIDFATTGSGGKTGSGYVVPSSWGIFGMEITTNSKAGAGKEARYFATGNDDAGTAIVIQDPDTTSPAMDPDGGQIVITLDMTHEKHMRLVTFGTEGGYSIIRMGPPDESGNMNFIDQVDYAGSAGVDEQKVDVDGVFKVVVALAGPGGLAEMKVCRNPDSTPAPYGPATNGSTDTPTASPTDESDQCPPGVIHVRTIGDTEFSSLPIEVVEYGETSVTFNVKQTIQESVTSFYTQYRPDQFGVECVRVENAVMNSYETYTAHCTELSKISIVDVYVADGALDAKLDIANVPECCHAPDGEAFPTVHYVFEVKCVDPCPPGDGESIPARKLEADVEGKHFCKPAEHPCGDAPDMVEVCHYSSKTGYKTFCVPDKDSDVVAYYPKDSCGPCDKQEQQNESVATE